MCLNQKELYKSIKDSFNKAVSTYSSNSKLQNLVCSNLILLLQEKAASRYEIVADFACGTCQSTEKLSQAFKPNRCYAIDIADQLLKIGINKLSHCNIEFIEESFDTKIFDSNKLNLAFSNMGFQWSLNLKCTFNRMHQQLKNNGILAFSIPIFGTFKEIKPEFKNYFYNKKEIINFLQKTGFVDIKYQELQYNEVFNTELAALQSIKNIGANIRKHTNNCPPLTVPIYLKNIFYKANQISLTQNIGLFIASKKNNLNL